MTKVIFVIGPPGSGKGTQCKLLSRKIGYVHISTGDMCREAIEKKTEFGKQIEPFLAQSRFVPDELIIQMIKARLEEPDAKARGVLLDGYPRTVRQARALVATGVVDVERFILIQVTEEICVSRIMFRRSDPVTGNIYNLKTAPPPKELERRLTRREMDKDEKNVRIRLQGYQMQLGQVLLCFQGRIQSLDGSKSELEVFADLEALLAEPIQAPLNVADGAPGNQSGSAKKKGKKKGKKPAPAVEPSQNCVVCMDRAAEFLIVPCGHQCGCEECLSALQRARGKCPICRQAINGLVRVYRSGIVDGEDKGEHLDEEDEDEVQEEHEQIADDGGWGEEAKKLELQNRLGQFAKDLSGEVKVTVAPAENVEASHGKVNVAVTIAPPDVKDRVPVDICCVVDISGSMGEDAKFQDPNNEKAMRSEGMNQLDIVKHSVKTILHCLTENDRMAVVSFSAHAVTAFPLTAITENGRLAAVHAVEALEPDGQTNIWAGLLAGLDALRAPREGPPQGGTRNRVILLLTDGQPNVSPPQGEPKSLAAYFESFPDFSCQVNTFGFGYSLDSRLMQDIAKTGNGTFAFIPDAKIVGTCFVNAVANAASNLSPNCTVHMTLKNKAAWNGPVGGNYPSQEVSWGRVVHIGPLQFGQSRDVVVPMQLPEGGPGAAEVPYLEVTIEYVHDGVHKVTHLASSREVTGDAIVAFLRNTIVSKVSEVTAELEKGVPAAVGKMKALVGTVAAHQTANRFKDVRIDGLHNDVSGRMSKAISTVERFKRWGKHYLLALVRSHQLQLRTNFMDPGLQAYGGSLSRTLEDCGGKIFITLPLKKYSDNPHPHPGRPAPARAAAAPARASVVAAKPAAPVAPANNAEYFGGAGGGCFADSCTLSVLRGLQEVTTPFGQVQRGDSVRVVDAAGQRGLARVQCVVRFDRPIAQDETLVSFPDSKLCLTRRHPVFLAGQWHLPEHVVAATQAGASPSIAALVPRTSKYLYNLVLEHTPSVMVEVNGVPCCTFAHGFKGPHVEHPFYGSDQVNQVLQQLPGWQDGLVVVSTHSLRSRS